jgi:hypothetical protein
MRLEHNHKEVFARPETLGEDFTLIFDAVADAFRGLSSSSRLESRWSNLRYGGGEC